MKGVTAFGNYIYVENLFQSTLPMKGVTDAGVYLGNAARVSIHTPNEGSDQELCRVLLR